MVKKVEPYSNYVITPGVLGGSEEQLLKEIIELCQEQAKEDLEVLGLGDKVPELYWRFEQQWRGMVNGKQTSAPIEFPGASPFIRVAWKLVP